MKTDQSRSTESLMKRYVLGNYARFPIAIDRGAGVRVWDEDGKEYLDFATGVAVCSLGHCHPAMTTAIHEQAERLIHCSNLYRIRGQAILAESLCEKVVRAPGRVFFCNSGAEANDGLIKLARKFGKAAPVAGGEARYEVITFGNSFHGRTLGGIAATAQAKVKEGFDPLLPGFRHLPFNDVEALRGGIAPETAALLFEAVQGEGGIHAASPEFMKAVAEVCREHRLLLMMDEVQCGIGRTGDLCGWKSLPGGDVLEPDAVSWAKGLGGGFPMGALWTRERPVSEEQPDLMVSDLLGPGTHGSTFGGSPLACAVGNAVLEEIETFRLDDNARTQGDFIRKEIASWKSNLVADVRGVGLMIGIVLNEDFLEGVPAFKGSGSTPAAHVIGALMSAGLLTVGAGTQVVRLLPPLNVTRDEVNEALATLRRVLNQIESEAEPQTA